MFQLDGLTDYGLLFMRIMAGAIYIDSGYQDLKDPATRAKSIEQSEDFTKFLGCAEIAGGAGIMLGILQQPAALGLIAIMAGAVQKKAFVWKTGFWGKDGFGWNYELTLVSMLVVILATNGGKFVIAK